MKGKKIKIVLDDTGYGFKLTDQEKMLLIKADPKLSNDYIEENIDTKKFRTNHALVKLVEAGLITYGGGKVHEICIPYGYSIDDIKIEEWEPGGFIERAILVLS